MLLLQYFRSPRSNFMLPDNQISDTIWLFFVFGGGFFQRNLCIFENILYEIVAVAHTKKACFSLFFCY